MPQLLPLIAESNDIAEAVGSLVVLDQAFHPPDGQSSGGCANTPAGFTFDFHLQSSLMRCWFFFSGMCWFRCDGRPTVAAFHSTVFKNAGQVGL